MEIPLSGKQKVPYLPLPQLQAEGACPERKRTDQYSLSKMREGFYQDKLIKRVQYGSAAWQSASFYALRAFFCAQ